MRSNHIPRASGAALEIQQLYLKLLPHLPITIAGQNEVRWRDEPPIPVAKHVVSEVISFERPALLSQTEAAVLDVWAYDVLPARAAASSGLNQHLLEALCNAVDHLAEHSSVAIVEGSLAFCCRWITHAGFVDTQRGTAAGHARRLRAGARVVLPSRSAA